jgi:hypothetical protein
MIPGTSTWYKHTCNYLLFFNESTFTNTEYLYLVHNIFPILLPGNPRRFCSIIRWTTMGKIDAANIGASAMTSRTTTSDSLGLGRTLLNTAFVFLWRMSQLVVGLGTVVAVLLYYKQDSMLYFPGEHKEGLMIGGILCATLLCTGNCKAIADARSPIPNMSIQTFHVTVYVSTFVLTIHL